MISGHRGAFGGVGSSLLLNADALVITLHCAANLSIRATPFKTFKLYKEDADSGVTNGRLRGKRV